MNQVNRHEKYLKLLQDIEEAYDKVLNTPLEDVHSVRNSVSIKIDKLRDSINTYIQWKNLNEEDTKCTH